MQNNLVTYVDAADEPIGSDHNDMRYFLEESKARLADLKERNHSGEKHGNYYGTTERFQPSSTAMPHMSSVKPSIGLRTTEFHGTSSWTDYSVQLEMVAELNLWDNREKPYSWQVI